MNTIHIYSGIIGRVVLILGGLHCFLTTFFSQYNNVSLQVSSTRPYLTTVFSGLLGLATLIFLFDRNYYLPFLGPCVIPTQKPNQSLEKSSRSFKLTGLPPNVSIVYWAAKSRNPDLKFTNYTDAYGDYSNSGVVITTDQGEADISISCPSEYSVMKFGIVQSQLPKHVHYRYELADKKGMYSEVFTKNISC